LLSQIPGRAAELARSLAKNARRPAAPSRSSRSANRRLGSVRRWAIQAEGVAATLGSAAGLDQRRVRGDLDRFKELIESRGAESGAWRGAVFGRDD